MQTTTRRDAAAEIARRRTFAIISHPDAGKTTLTEKLLLYGGAIHTAGSVKARRAARHATSDWMKLEQERGISITSSVLQFEWQDHQLNLLDTPGHQDFSEDTYRTLIAADSAVMLLDNRKGVEEQTRKLFAVCHRRRTPMFVFVNKCDRPGEPPLKLIDDVESDLGITCYPITWPIMESGRLIGVYDRVHDSIHRFEREGDHGSKRARVRVASLDSDEARELLGDAHAQLVDDIELLEHAGAEFDRDAVLDGRLAPTFFGSALTNFGVEPFLNHFLRLAPPPGPRETENGTIAPDDDAFTGFVFKIQANMDPKHRDRIAFVRITSGRYEPAMQVLNTRSGERIRLAQPQQFMAQERRHVEDAWAGDVIGVHDRGSLRIGDTLSSNGDLMHIEHMPRFSPEHFARISVPDPLRRKHLDKGLRQLSEEGAAQVFYASTHVSPEPIVGAVGRLQFDVLLHRLEHEYNVVARLEPLSWKIARWVVGPEKDIQRVANGMGKALVYDAKNRPLILFDNEWTLRNTTSKEDGLEYLDVAP